ncbi:MAG: GNAT family N-acetyltransferase [Bacteroidetes bacterium MedPE-SWsnd-G2]|nr:MAG: GNAT family N-acetyltransferase [Bacteroidetes bacterium MedPE-SWsnd-G2]
MDFVKTENNDTVAGLREELYQSLSAPIDAMWEILYISNSEHYLIQDKEECLGYCCVTDQNSLIQLYLKKVYRYATDEVVKQLIAQKIIASASLSSNEPIAFNAFLKISKSKDVNTFCFQHVNEEMKLESELNLELVTEESILDIKLFLKTQLGMDDTFGYTENLVRRKEIFMLKESGLIVATSELIMSDTQVEIADLGVIVNRDFQGKGLATQILKTQVNRVLKRGRKPICSTTLDNVASQKAITKSGFYCSNIIFDMTF